MSFGTYARRVRDEGTPAARRHVALRCAVSEYCPLGFHATWAYVSATALPSPDLRRDSRALLRALGILEASRAVRIAEGASFAARRRVEKAAGLRTPRGAPVTQVWRPHWPTATGTAPSRLGLVAAVADRHRAFGRLPRPDGIPLTGGPATDGLATEGPAARLTELHGRLEACGTAYLTALGLPDAAARAELSDTVTGIRGEVRPGHAALNHRLFQWLGFADLLGYAAEVSPAR
ncbi:hypothetical protein [Streptomyces zaomyceticus]|uniref:hypothetical protein n=1 Tax=Streptomyces zaomyceticus TaxID=68286 RepID=UPI001676016A|nr:hypothetical protein [Streptomyces zaomyceticus]GHG18874.1 hypothetical protein GCM10018791_36970 [Streptomyces zaomyceticus]